MKNTKINPNYQHKHYRKNRQYHAPRGNDQVKEIVSALVDIAVSAYSIWKAKHKRSA